MATSTTWLEDGSVEIFFGQEGQCQEFVPHDAPGLDKVSEWLPPSSAPKDGTIILVRVDGDDWPMVAAYMKNGPDKVYYQDDKKLRWYLGPGRMAEEWVVTGWMPFPIEIEKLSSPSSAIDCVS
jgi:hypothetical protein